MVANTCCRSPWEIEITLRTSDVAAWCSRASFSSRVRLAASPSSAVDELRRGTALGALRRFGSGVLRRRPLIGSLPALERLFIASTVGQRHRTRTTTQTKSGLFVLLNRPLLRHQLLQQRLRRLQIARVKPFSEPAVNRSEQFARLLHLPWSRQRRAMLIAARRSMPPHVLSVGRYGALASYGSGNWARHARHCRPSALVLKCGTPTSPALQSAPSRPRSACGRQRRSRHSPLSTLRIFV